NYVKSGSRRSSCVLELGRGMFRTGSALSLGGGRASAVTSGDELSPAATLAGECSYTRTPVMCTVLPISVIDAPRPLSIMIQASLTVLCEPEDVRRVMPPNGPDASEMTSACRPGVASVI